MNDFADEHIERYLHVSSIRCANCGGLHGTLNTTDGEELTAGDLGIQSEDEWEAEMEAKEDWMRSHQGEVLVALTKFEDEWGQSVQAIRDHVLTVGDKDGESE